MRTQKSNQTSAQARREKLGQTILSFLLEGGPDGLIQMREDVHTLMLTYMRTLSKGHLLVDQSDSLNETYQLWLVVLDECIRAFKELQPAQPVHPIGSTALLLHA
jgi:hypothetical protein